MELKAEKRDSFGKKTGVLRREGLIPAELYGHGVENMHLAVAAKDFARVYREAGSNTVVNLAVGDLTKMVMIHNVHMDYLNNSVLAVDFYEVKMDEEITASVPLEFVNESPAVKDLGGILVKAMDEVEIEALPQNIPAAIAVDLSKLTGLGESIYVKDLPTGANYEYKVDPNTVVVTASEPKEEIAAPEITPESVVVETEEKKAEREANKQESGNEA